MVNIRSCKSWFQRPPQSYSYKPMRNAIAFLSLCSGVPYSIADDGKLIIHRIRKWVEVIITVAALIAEAYFQSQRKPGERNLYSILSHTREMIKIIYVTFYNIDLATNHNRIKMIFDRLKELDQHLQLNDKRAKNFRRKITAWIVFLTPTCLFFIILRHLKHNFGWILNFIFLLFYSRLYFQRVTNEMLFASLAVLINNYLLTLTDTLIEDKEAETPVQTLYNGLERGERKISGRRVDELRNLYRRIYHIKNAINEAFSFRLCVLTIYTFTELVYYTFINIIIYSANVNTPMYDKIYPLMILLINLWLFLLVLKFLQLIGVSHSVAANFKRLPLTIYELRSSTFNKFDKDELTVLAEEATQRNPYFVACNLFEIDYPLISSVLQGAVMHIIILLQFMYSNSDNMNGAINHLLFRN